VLLFFNVQGRGVAESALGLSLGFQVREHNFKVKAGSLAF
jgi:hypothetical protein